MIRTIVLISTLLLLTSCSKTISNTKVSREVPTITFETILADPTLVEVVDSLDTETKGKFRIWLTEKLIPYVSYLETELQYSTPTATN